MTTIKQVIDQAVADLYQDDDDSRPAEVLVGCRKRQRVEMCSTLRLVDDLVVAEEVPSYSRSWLRFSLKPKKPSERQRFLIAADQQLKTLKQELDRDAEMFEMELATEDERCPATQANLTLMNVRWAEYCRLYGKLRGEQA